MSRYLACLVLAACGGKANSFVPQRSASTTAQPQKPAAVAHTTTTTPQLGVGANLAEQCNVRISSREQAPKFDYDNFQLLPDDRSVLEQIADCLTRGPLRGRTLDLVGRADPRGTEEYNLGLGMRRATTVSDFLQRLGVPALQLHLSTRGDLDANGGDESSWKTDRRVDLQLRPI